MPWFAAMLFASIATASAGERHRGQGMPGAPRLTINAEVVASDCPLYIIRFDEREVRKDYVLEGRIANAGPGTARGVKVEGIVFDREGGVLGKRNMNVTPGKLSPGRSGTFSEDFRSTHWNRMLADVEFGHMAVQVSFANCRVDEEDPVDDEGTPRSEWWREILEIQEELHRVEDARGEVDPSDPAGFQGTQDLRAMERSIANLKRELEVTIPRRMDAAGAPAEWIDVPTR